MDGVKQIKPLNYPTVMLSGAGIGALLFPLLEYIRASKASEKEKDYLRAAIKGALFGGASGGLLKFLYPYLLDILKRTDTEKSIVDKNIQETDDGSLTSYLYGSLKDNPWTTLLTSTGFWRRGLKGGLAGLVLGSILEKSVLPPIRKSVSESLASSVKSSIKEQIPELKRTYSIIPGAPKDWYY